jgi:hypothetical protein
MGRAVIMGTLVHSMTQHALLHKNFTTEYFHGLMYAMMGEGIIFLLLFRCA